MQLEILMAAYNNYDVMKLVFDGYINQTDKDFLLTVGDDGSTPEIKDLCDEYAQKGLKIRHIWHEDHGYRRATILNKALCESTSDFIVFTDNDCIPHPKFVEDHKENAQEGYFSIGRRCDLKEEISHKLLTKKICLNSLFNPAFLIFQSFIRHLKRPECAMSLPVFICLFLQKKHIKALGANMGVWREDLITINGFDNKFQGYGFEESDLENRLIKLGIIGKSIKGKAGLIHLYHPERSVSDESFFIFQERSKNQDIKVKDGIYNLNNLDCHQAQTHSEL